MHLTTLLLTINMLKMCLINVFNSAFSQSNVFYFVLLLSSFFCLFVSFMDFNPALIVSNDLSYYFGFLKTLLSYTHK